jgi:hypothetical protein
MSLRRLIEEPKFQEDIREMVVRIQKNILEQREEILTAFVAKYGVGPEEVMQVLHYDPVNGTVLWWIEKRRSDGKDYGPGNKKAAG